MRYPGVELSTTTVTAGRSVFFPRSLPTRWARLPCFLLAILLTGCAHTSVTRSIGDTEYLDGSDRVLLMPLDVQLMELTAGGLREPNAQWTHSAKEHIENALTELLAERQDTLVLYQAPKNDPGLMHTHDQMLKLHEAVGRSILIHQHYPVLALPTKQNRFDYSLGADVASLGEGHSCRYALFIYLRDSYASGERVAAMVAAAMFGIGLQGGMQVGFASLVDLETGDVVWFNRLVSEAGDLRTLEPARKAVDDLLTDFPL